MAKKDPTPAQLEARRKFSEASKARAAARKQASITPEVPASAPQLEAEPKTTISQVEYNDLMRQIQELKSMQFQPQPLAPTVGIVGGKLVGTTEKFRVDPSLYPNPIERLLKESKLSRFALDINYHMGWKVSISEYTTIDNIRVKEPKFTLELGKKRFDEDTGEPILDKDGNQEAYIISRFIMHEDPEAALVIARNEGIDVDETNEEDFLNEMRYLRMRDWLVECFFPSPIKKIEKKEMVIGGTVVETYNITSTQNEKIEFDQLKRANLG